MAEDSKGDLKEFRVEEGGVFSIESAGKINLSVCEQGRMMAESLHQRSVTRYGYAEELTRPGYENFNFRHDHVAAFRSAAKQGSADSGQVNSRGSEPIRDG